ncbi:MAG: ribosome recycling factor [Chloroflexi bacterium]|nr:ribosome recycling factor [Chloroflexota bacterium]
MIADVLKDSEGRMRGAIEALKADLLTLRTGRASPAILEKIKVEYYDTELPLNQLASISAPDPHLLAIKPFDPGALGAIEKAILKSDLGLNPQNDGKIIRLPIPQLSAERRKELGKLAAKRGEEARIAVRNVRRDALHDLKEMEDEKLISEDEHFRGKEQMQELTDRYVEMVNEIEKSKEKEILDV